jgi:hypothetical protein
MTAFLEWFSNIWVNVGTKGKEAGRCAIPTGKVYFQEGTQGISHLFHSILTLLTYHKEPSYREAPT